jgi:hypothetical protein
VDYERAELASTSTVRGWETLPAFLGSAPKRNAAPKTAPAPAAAAAPEVVKDVPFEGTWDLVVKGPTGPERTVLVIAREGQQFTGTQTGQGSTSPLTDVTVDGNKVSWINHVTKPMKLKVHFAGEISGRKMTGKLKVGFVGSFSFTAEKR